MPFYNVNNNKTDSKCMIFVCSNLLGVINIKYISYNNILCLTATTNILSIIIIINVIINYQHEIDHCHCMGRRIMMLITL